MSDGDENLQSWRQASEYEEHLFLATLMKHSDALLIADNISRDFGHHRAVDQLSFTLKRGEIVALLGLNGAGKSTTLKMLSGILAPATGQVLVAGYSLWEQPRAAKHELGFAPEQLYIDVDLSLERWLLYCCKLRMLPPARREARCREVLEQLQLTSVRQTSLRALSRGQQQRALVAQALVHQPQVLILDEPTTGLDPLQMTQLRELLKRVSCTTAILLSTHLLSEAVALCQRVFILRQGRLIYTGPTAADSTRYRVKLARPPQTSELTTIEQVTAVRALDPYCFDLDIKPGVAIELITASCQRWGLLEFQAMASDLERVFLDAHATTES